MALLVLEHVRRTARWTPRLRQWKTSGSREKDVVLTAKESLAHKSWQHQWEALRDRAEGAPKPFGGGLGSGGIICDEMDTPHEDQSIHMPKHRTKKTTLEMEKHDTKYLKFDSSGGFEPHRDQAPSGENRNTPESDFAEEAEPEGSERLKYVDAEIMKMEARVLKAAARKEARESMWEVTHPVQSQFTFCGKLIPPPPLLSDILVPSAMRMGEEVYVNKRWKHVYEGGPNDVYLDSGPNAASEVAFFGAEKSGKSALINAITEQKIAVTGARVGGTRGIDFYQCPDPKLWKEAWSDGPTKYPAATKLSRTHWGGQLVDLPGFPVNELRPYAKDTFYQCVAQYYEGCRRQLKGTFYCIDATVGMTRSDLKWLRTIPDLHTRVSTVSIVLTKADLVDHSRLCQVMHHIYQNLSKRRFRAKIAFPIIPTSALYGWGVPELRGHIVTKAELLPWWKRLEEVRAVMDQTKERAREENEAYLEARVEAAEKFKALSEWSDTLSRAINDTEYGNDEQAREAEYALVRLQKEQESKLGMYVEGMGARFNPLVKNPYVHSMGSGGVMGPGMAPTTLEDYVKSLKPTSTAHSDVMKQRLEDLEDVAVQYPSHQQRYQRDWVRRTLGERTDAVIGVEKYSPTFATDPDITQEEWDGLPQEELEEKVRRAGATRTERMNYGFTLDEVREAALGKQEGSALDKWDFENAAYAYEGEADREQQLGTEKSRKEKREDPPKDVYEVESVEVEASEVERVVVEPLEDDTRSVIENIADQNDGGTALQSEYMEPADDTEEVVEGSDAPPKSLWGACVYPSRAWSDVSPYKMLGVGTLSLRLPLWGTGVEESGEGLHIPAELEGAAEEEGGGEGVEQPGSVDWSEAQGIAAQVLKMRQKQREAKNAEPLDLAEDYASKAVPKPTRDVGADEALHSAARLGLGLPKHEGKPEGSGDAGGGGPQEKWDRFVETLKDVPPDVLRAAQPVDKGTKLYKPYWSEPTRYGESYKMQDNLGANNEPVLLDQEAVKKELYRKQQGPHYMGFPWMSHEQIPAAMALQDKREASKLTRATYRAKIRGLQRYQRYNEYGPAVIRDKHQRATTRHIREEAEFRAHLKSQKGRKSIVMMEVADMNTPEMRFRHVISGKPYGPLMRTVDGVLGESQGLPPFRLRQLNKRRVQLGLMDQEELDLQTPVDVGAKIAVANTPRRMLLAWAAEELGGTQRYAVHFNSKKGRIRWRRTNLKVAKLTKKESAEAQQFHLKGASGSKPVILGAKDTPPDEQ